jgi:uncharacterized membrane protein
MAAVPLNRPAVVIPIVLLVTILGALGQTLIKRALNAIPADLGGLRAVHHAASNPVLYAGFVVTGLGTLSWLYVLSRAPLSYATPFAGVGIVLVMLCSAFLLGEPVGSARIAGTIVIAIGVALVARS